MKMLSTIQSSSFALFFSLFLLSFSLKAQSGAENAVLVEQLFEKDVNYQFTVERGKIDSEVPGSEKIKGITNVSFKVLGKQDGLLLCSWTYGNSWMEGVEMDPLSDKTASAELSVYEGVEVKFLLTEGGSMERIVDFESLKKQLWNCMEKMTAASGRQLTDAEQKELKSIFESSSRDPDILVATYFPEIPLYFNLFGLDVELNELYTAESELPNPFGGPNFPSEQKLTVLGTSAGQVRLLIDEVVDGKALEHFIKEYAKQHSHDKNSVKISSVKMVVFSSYHYDMAKKKLLSASTIKETSINGKSRGQSLSVTLK